MIDNSDLFEIYDRERERKLEKLPTCRDCAQPIQQWDAVEIDGEWYCDQCLNDRRRETIDDL